LTAGYPAAFKTFVGRALDSHDTQQLQNNPMRTLTAYRVRIDPGHNRLYALVGSAVMAYDLSRFFNRLEASEPLVALAGRPGQFAERYLLPDCGQFYAEHSQEWVAPVTDGQNRLFDLAFDDRGIVYPAYSTFGWGALRATAGGLENVFQIPTNDATGDPIVFNVLPVKFGGEYFVIASPESGPSALYFVGTASTLVHEHRGNIDVRVAASAKAEDGRRIGVIDTNGKIRFFTDESILRGVEVDGYDFHTWPSGMLPSGIASDGNVFYTVLSGAGLPAILSTFTPAGTKYTRADQTLPSPMQAPKLDWGAGFLTLYGVDSVGRNLQVFKTPSLEPVSLNNFFVKYYHLNGDPAFATPISSGLDTSSAPGAHALTVSWNGRTLVNVMAGGLWDAYELRTAPSTDVFASFTFSPASVDPGGAVTFTDQSSGPVSARSWDFGDGSAPSASANPSHTYTTAGTFVVKLTVSGPTNQSSATRTLKVGTVPDNANTTINAAPASAKLNESITFSVQTTGWNLSGSEGYVWNFGDGTPTSAAKTPAHTYAAAGPVTVTLQLTNNAGTGTVTKALQILTATGGGGIKIPNMSNTSIIIAPASAKVGVPLGFSVLPDGWSLSGGEQYVWNFGDGTAQSTGATPQHTYGTGGFFTVTLQLTNSAGTGTLSRQLQVQSDSPVGPPVPSTSNTEITVSPASAKAGDALNFGIQTFGWTLNGAEVCVWNFGDGTPQTLATSTTHSYAGAGFVSVSLQITNSAGTGTVTKGIQITPLGGGVIPNMSNTAILIAGSTKVGESLGFSVQADGWTLTGGENYVWNFGDGTPTSAVRNPAHTFGNSGFFTVTLQLTNSAGTGTLSRQVQIQVALDFPLIPNASNTQITVVPGSAKVGELLTFGVQPSGWNLSGAEAYLWSFGDGTAQSTSNSPTHPYGAAGSFSVSLQLTNNAGTGNITKSVQISPLPPPIPNMSNAEITVVPGSAKVGEPLNFGVQPTGWNLNGSETYVWNFGDGTQPSTLKSPTHPYGAVGIFSVSLQLTNSAGTGTITKSVQISPLPPPVPNMSNTEITVVPGSAKVGDSLTFGVQTTGWNLSGSEAFVWNFGDGTAQSPAKSPAHSFSSAGSVTVNLKLTNSSGTGTITKSILIEALPPQGERIAAILPVVGSVQGGSAFFRTEVQIHNPGAAPIAGKFVFHVQGTPGAETDPSMPYSLAPGETVDFPDLLPAMGLSGVGSLDIVTSDPLPVTVARVFSDAGDAGTAGFTLDPVPPSAALRAGESGVLIAPSDPGNTTFNIGVRTLDADTAMRITVHDRSGVEKGTVEKSYASTFFEQVRANFFLGFTLDGSDTVTFAISEGAAIIYGSSTDNRTHDPSLQYAKRLA
jgi:PKD repeat protein